MSQITEHILMIRPAGFGYNTETAENNSFQNRPDTLSFEEVTQQAKEEFDNFVNILRAEGVDVMVVEDTDEPRKPDAVFPNNWISFHRNGTVVTYPMFSKLRRQERRNDLVDQLKSGFNIQREIHLEDFESNDQYLEGTGSMVLDRANRIAYACISDRTDRDLLESWCSQLNYISHTFYAESNGVPIYHTNVMMAIATQIVVVCLECLPLKDQRKQLADSLSKHRTVVEITDAQVQSFAGNMLALKNNKGEELMVMSKRAHESLTADQIKIIEQSCRIVSVPINTIEDVGGGSARCMIAEIFLEPK